MADISLPIADIRTDGGTQPRAAINPVVVSEYADDMTEGATFPAVTVFYDGTHYWLADGFHRLAAARQIGLVEIDCIVRQGILRDAVLYSVGANASHGMRRTNTDKQRAVKTLLQDDEWSKWTDREIARRCAVEHHMVGQLRSSLGDSPSDRTYTTKHGTEATMRTGNIGRASAPADPRPAADDPDEGSTLPEPRQAPASAPFPADRFQHASAPEGNFSDWLLSTTTRIAQLSQHSPLDPVFNVMNQVLLQEWQAGRLTIR